MNMICFDVWLCDGMFVADINPTISELARFLENQLDEVDTANTEMNAELYFSPLRDDIPTFQNDEIPTFQNDEIPTFQNDDEITTSSHKHDMFSGESFMKLLTIVVYPRGRTSELVIKNLMKEASTQVYTEMVETSDTEKYSTFRGSDGSIKKKYVVHKKKNLYSSVVFRRALKLVGVKMEKVENLTDINYNFTDTFVVYGMLHPSRQTMVSSVSDCHVLLIKNGRLFCITTGRSNTSRQQLKTHKYLLFTDDGEVKGDYLSSVSKVYKLNIPAKISIPSALKH